MAVSARVSTCGRRSAIGPTMSASRRHSSASSSRLPATASRSGRCPKIADADPPHRPSGCVAQAWSVAELLRALAWDLA